ncbi:MAG TPA: transcription-repair coupling factor, partial [Acidimicrobiales bacterium]|nr:transcription-repair coupling factor [Acidimicrobiales bacterium]
MVEVPPAALSPLLRVLRTDETFSSLRDLRSAVVAVPEPARAFALAGIADASRRRPVLVAVPTNAEAERLANDIAAFVGQEQVDLCPAWETLPFERVSPSVETMGRRLRTMWRLRSGPDRIPRVLIAPVRSLLQRLGPHVEDTAPVTINKGDQVDPQELVARLISLGYRREYQVEHRGEVAVRGSIVDVFGATDDVPVRIDLWGDEVDRLSEFSVGDQRSTGDVECVELFACRELRPSDEVRERAAALVGDAPWGRQQWERIADGQVFDGMESWLPWLSAEEHLLVDLLPDDALIVLVEPRRMRDRAAELLDEEESLAGTLAQTWGAAGDDFPRLHLPFDRLLAHTKAAAWTLTAAPENPGTEVVAATGWDPIVGGGERLMGQLRQLKSDGYRIVVCAEGRGSGTRLSALLNDQGVDAPLLEPTAAGADPPAFAGASVIVQPLERGFLYPAAKIAVLAEGDITGR